VGGSGVDREEELVNGDGAEMVSAMEISRQLPANQQSHRG
jgi:hypothetical protein